MRKSITRGKDILGKSRVDMTNRLRHTLCREWVREGGSQKTKRPRGQEGKRAKKKGKRTRVVEMAGLQREEQLGGGKVQTVRGGGRVCPPEGSC